jgi:hypothetical protein
MADDIQFVAGLLVKPPHEKAPSFVKASISIKVAELGMWLRERHKAGEEWVNIDIKEAKSGKWYASVSTFKKEEKPAAPKKPAADDDGDIPF